MNVAVEYERNRSVTNYVEMCPNLNYGQMFGTDKCGRTLNLRFPINLVSFSDEAPCPLFFTRHSSKGQNRTTAAMMRVPLSTKSVAQMQMARRMGLGWQRRWNSSQTPGGAKPISPHVSPERERVVSYIQNRS